MVLKDLWLRGYGLWMMSLLVAASVSWYHVERDCIAVAAVAILLAWGGGEEDGLRFREDLFLGSFEINFVSTARSKRWTRISFPSDQFERITAESKFTFYEVSNSLVNISI